MSLAGGVGGGSSVVRRQGVGSGDQPHVPLLGPRTLHTQAMRVITLHYHSYGAYIPPPPFVFFWKNILWCFFLWVNDCN